jgi:type I restriction enzyme S subunit
MRFLPETWILIPLGDCCQIISGSTPKRNKPEYWGGDIPWVTPKDLSKLRTPVLEDAPEKITEAGYKSCSTTLLPQGSILFSSRAPIGYVAIAGRPMCTNQGFKSLVPNEYVHSPYLYWCMRQYASDIEALGSGTTFKEVSKGIVERFKIPLPPLEEQRRIAAILDKADGVRRKRKEAIRLTEELLKSTFLEMFGDPVTNPKGWEVKRLGEICTNFQNGIGKNSEHYGHGSKVANISDLYEWHRFIPEKYSLLDVTPKEIEKYSLMRGDLLFVRSSVKREGVAVCSVYDSDEICLFSSFMIRVRPRTDLINPEFLSLMLRTPPMRNRLILGSNTSTITNISQPGLSKIEVVVPPIKTQNLITKVTKNIEESVRCHLQALEQSENLFNSLLQRAFRGEL